MIRSFVLLWMLLALVLVACEPQGTEPPLEPSPTPGEQPAETPTEAVSTPGETAGGNGMDGYDELVAALEAAGATVAPAGELEQPFFDVAAQLIEVNGAQVQVFEFADDASRQEASALIGASGSEIGTTVIDWVAPPHFWAQGRIIVLYVGEDEAVISMLSELLGETINEPPPMSGPNAPEAVDEALQNLSNMLGQPVEAIEIVSVEEMVWPDGCLGLAQPDEMCTMALVPGWQIIVRVDGAEYEVRTDETGSNVRWRPLAR